MKYFGKRATTYKHPESVHACLMIGFIIENNRFNFRSDPRAFCIGKPLDQKPLRILSEINIWIPQMLEKHFIRI